MNLIYLKEANAIFDSKQWPTLLDIEESTKKKLSAFHRPPSSDRLCYLDFSVSTTGMLAGIRVSHTCSTSICRAIKLSCELYPSREVVLCLDPYSGLGFVLWCLNRYVDFKCNKKKHINKIKMQFAAELKCLLWSSFNIGTSI